MLDSAKFLRLQERQKESGLSVKGFCSNEGIAPSCFYYWQKKIRNQVNAKRFIPLVVKPTVSDVPKFMNQRPIPNQSDESISFEITYSNGTTLRVKNDMELDRLRTLISLLD
jgi:hypothetical protein